MAKILIYKDHYPYGEYDLEHQTNYDNIIKTIDEHYGGVCPNYGNKLWLQGIMTVLNNGTNELVYLDSTMTIDYINSEFDYIVLPMANIFYVGYTDALY